MSWYGDDEIEDAVDELDKFSPTITIDPKDGHVIDVTFSKSWAENFNIPSSYNIKRTIESWIYLKTEEDETDN